MTPQRFAMLATGLLLLTVTAIATPATATVCELVPTDLDPCYDVQYVGAPLFEKFYGSACVGGTIQEVWEAWYWTEVGYYDSDGEWNLVERTYSGRVETRNGGSC